MPFSKRAILTFLLLLLAVLFLVPAGDVHAQEHEIQLSVDLPGTSPCSYDATKKCVADFGDYMANFYRWFVSVSGVLAIAMLVMGGFMWITATGNSSKIESAKDVINSALSGVVLLMLSFLFLQLINPQILSLRLPIPGITGSDFFLDSTILCNGRAILEDRDTATCGDIVSLDIATAVGVKQPCIWNECKDPKEVCAPNPKVGKYECLTPIKGCTYSKPKDCQAVDLIFQNTVPPVTEGGKVFSCRTRNLTDAIPLIGYEDDCSPGPIWSTYAPLPVKDLVDSRIADSGYQCGDDADWMRVTCDAGKGRKTECWRPDDGGPREETKSINDPWWAQLDNHMAVSYIKARLTCTDAARANQTSDMVCCGQRDKGQIDCRGIEEKIDENEIAVPCDYYNTLTDEYDGKLSTNSKAKDKNATRDWCDDICFMQIDIKFGL
ncbi:MAG: pilin [Patescibacteria group bacterium]|jgi:hypothetical protein